MHKQDLDWIFNLKNEVPNFLDKLKSRKVPGFYSYSLSGDYFNERIKWGLGNSVFFLKIIYTLNLENKYKQDTDKALIFIKSFQNKNGIFYDPLVNILSAPLRVYRDIKNLSFNNVLNKQTRRAETRQALSSLNLFSAKANYKYIDYPSSKEEVDNYLLKLNWDLTWNAGSHFSHLLFFLNQSNLNNKQELITYTIGWVNKLQHKKDGFWYKRNATIQQKINGAMKIMTGLKAVNRVNFQYAEKIIDNCLVAENKIGACDNFNIVYVLRYCNEMLGGDYRLEEIKTFMQERLEKYRKYYYSELGGFSFYKGKSNKFYYDALLTKGKNEPDIHGTVMFLWGISLIAQVLDVNDELKFKEFIA